MRYQHKIKSTQKLLQEYTFGQLPMNDLSVHTSMVLEYLWDKCLVYIQLESDKTKPFLSILSFDQVAAASYISHDLEKSKSDICNGFIPPINKTVTSVRGNSNNQ